MEGSGILEMITTKMAIVLIAGESKRLRPLTDEIPKCFLEISGRRILDNTLQSLANHGCKKVRLVVGHQSQKVYAAITERYRDMIIEYIENPYYQSTNSMFSLYLGLKNVEEPSWIIEGDVFFSQNILERKTNDTICWFVDSSVRQLDGAFLEDDGTGNAHSLSIIRDLSMLKPLQYKSLGILHTSTDGSLKIQQWLNCGIKENRHNDYYDLIIADHLQEEKIKLIDINGEKWFEIDTPSDLEMARELFS